MRIRIPAMKVCREFHLTYELRGAQKGVDVLTRYYGIRRMKIVVDGRRVGNGCEAEYFEGGYALFTKRGFKKINVLHELYHHVVEFYGLDMSEKKEERLANVFVKKVVKRSIKF